MAPQPVPLTEAHLFPDPSFDLAHYRVTFFFGPEPVDQHPERLSCVFNVKKRSWKGGVQVAVEIDQEQLNRARRTLGWSAWLDHVLSSVPDDEREGYRTRAEDLLAQALCACKLDLLLHAGLAQENQRIRAEAWSRELDRAVVEHQAMIKSRILTELDLIEGSNLAANK